MKFKHAILLWVCVTLFYLIFAKEGVPIWNAFYFGKDCILPAFILYDLYWYKISKSDKRLCIIAFLIYCVKFITEIGMVLDIFDVSSSFDTAIYTISLLIILIIVGYDTKK